MKLTFQTGITVAFLILCAVAARPSYAIPQGFNPTPVWQDNFTYPTGNPPAPASLEPNAQNWTFDTGTGVGGWGNNELETYIADPLTNVTLPAIAHCELVPDGASPTGSALQITANLVGGNWQSARVKTEASSLAGSQPEYGYIESAIETSAAQGLFPGWFMLGADSTQPGGPVAPFGPWPDVPAYQDIYQVGFPECGQIDLFQLYSVSDPGAPYVYNTMYTDEQGGTVNGGISFNQGSVTYNPGAYGIYGFLWTPTTMTNFYNGTAFDSGVNPGGPFDQPFYILYDLAVGGNYGAPTADTATMRIGYVRVYEPNGHVEPPNSWTLEEPPVGNNGEAPFVIPEDDPWQLAPRSQPSDLLQLYGNETSDGYGIFALPPGSPNASANKTWTFLGAGAAGDYSISPAPGVCLQAGGWSAGSYLEAWSCEYNSLQAWNVVPTPDGNSPPKYYQLQPASSVTLCATVNTSNVSDGNNYPIVLDTCNTNSDDDEWTVLPFAVSPPGGTGIGGTPPEVGPTLTASGGYIPSPPTPYVSLNWTTYDGSSSYNIYRGTASGDEVPTFSSPVTNGNRDFEINGYTDTSVTDFTTYCYQVAAVNSNGTSPLSKEQCATPGPSPVPPTNLTATPGNQQVILDWTPSQGALSYDVFRGTAPAGEATTPVANHVSGTAYTDMGLVNNTTYYYVVSAVNSAGQSPYSNEASATPIPPPTAPANLTATAGDTQVTLNWSAVGSATSYRVLMGEASGGESPTNITVTSPTTVITGLTDGTQYFFTVEGVNLGGDSLPSNEASATPEPPKASAPTNLTATGGVNSVTLNWSAAATATSYSVYQATTSGEEGTSPVQTGITGTTVVIGNLTNNVTYYFTVSAVNGGGTGNQSLEVSATPQPLTPLAPTNLAASPGNASVTLTWTASTGASSYNVYVGQSPGGENPTPILPQVTATTALVPGLTDGTTYYFTVKAVNTGGISPASNEVAFTPSPPPPAPANLTATGGVGQVTLNWSAVANTSSYSVFMGTVSGGESQIATLSGISLTTAVVTGLTNGTTYYFQVEALNIGGASNSSNEASATPQPAVPPAPTNLTATAGDTEITLNWTASGSATSYNVYMGTTPGGEGSVPLQPDIQQTQSLVPGLTNGVTYYFTVSGVNGGGAGAPSNEASATPGENVTIPAGIQLFSVPYGYTGTALDAFFVGTMYVWSPTQFEYLGTADPTAANLQIGVGYWANFPQPVVFTPGVPASTSQPFSISLSAGWNQVGDPFQKNVPISGLTFNGGAESFAEAVSSGLIGPSVWLYDQTANGGLGGYADAVSGDGDLDVGSGDWVYATVATVMQVPPPQ